jgi:hypothetical protein
MLNNGFDANILPDEEVDYIYSSLVWNKLIIG